MHQTEAKLKASHSNPESPSIRATGNLDCPPWTNGELLSYHDLVIVRPSPALQVHAVWCGRSHGGGEGGGRRGAVLRDQYGRGRPGLHLGYGEVSFDAWSLHPPTVAQRGAPPSGSGHSPFGDVTKERRIGCNTPKDQGQSQGGGLAEDQGQPQGDGFTKGHSQSQRISLPKGQGQS